MCNKIKTGNVKNHGILYRILGMGGIVLYEGKSNSFDGFKGRIVSHSKEDWFSEMLSIEYRYIEVARLSDIERHFQRVNKPKYCINGIKVKTNFNKIYPLKVSKIIVKNMLSTKGIKCYTISSINDLGIRMRKMVVIATKEDRTMRFNSIKECADYFGKNSIQHIIDNGKDIDGWELKKYKMKY